MARGLDTLPLVGALSDPHGMTTLARAYLEWMGERHYSERTVESHLKNLRPFLRWCNERGLVRANEVTRPMLERYQRHLFHYRKADGAPLSVAAQCSRLRTVQGLCRWLTKANLILANPASELDLPRMPRQLPKHVLTVEELERVLSQPEVLEPQGLRDRAMMEVLYSTGMRRMELAQLGVFDVDAARRTVMIRQGKGHKDRVAPIGQRALLWVLKYLNEVRPEWVVEPDCGRLFLSDRGNAIEVDYLTELVSRYIDRAGVGKRGSCHLFRHSVATLMLDNGADIRFVQAFLGHASIQTTQIYTQVSIRQLQQIHAATHPAERRAKPREVAETSVAPVLASIEQEGYDGDDEQRTEERGPRPGGAAPRR